MASIRPVMSQFMLQCVYHARHEPSTDDTCHVAVCLSCMLRTSRCTMSRVNARKAVTRRVAWLGIASIQRGADEIHAGTRVRHLVLAAHRTAGASAAGPGWPWHSIGPGPDHARVTPVD